MKAERPHRVPLASGLRQVLARARQYRDGSGLLFPSDRTGAPLHGSTLSKAAKACGLPVLHGARSTFRDWAAESGRRPRRGGSWRWRTTSARQPSGRTGAQTSSRRAGVSWSSGAPRLTAPMRSRGILERCRPLSQDASASAGAFLYPALARYALRR